jgi:hypothetical protein
MPLSGTEIFVPVRAASFTACLNHLESCLGAGLSFLIAKVEQ